jgi:hypothetical protein
MNAAKARYPERLPPTGRRRARGERTRAFWSPMALPRTLQGKAGHVKEKLFA